MISARHSLPAWIAASCLLALPLDAAQSKSKKSSTSKKTTAKATPLPKEKPEPSAPPIDKESAADSYAPNASIAASAIREFAAQPAAVKQLLESTLALAAQNLTYKYGSADPGQGGLDCSGFVYFALRQHGFAQVPRDASGIYTWVRKARTFRAVVSHRADSFEFDELLPGDLLFWTGTYAMEKDPPVSHVMIYLGTENDGGGRIMAGSSDGRSYRGKKRNGASVFDFTLPREESRASFIGYARIPGLRD